jgi:uncharacterized membrane protein
MTLIIVLIALRMLNYFGNDIATFFQPDIYIDRLVVLRIHIAASIVAALTGPLQFIPAFRNRFRAIHRTIGKLYIVAVLIGAVFGFMMATTALGGIISQTGFSVLAILWAGATLVALQKIRNRDIVGHSRWMIRSFALTFSFVSLRIIFPTLQFGVGLDQTTAFKITSWACWLVNLMIVEFALSGGRGGLGHSKPMDRDND